MAQRTVGCSLSDNVNDVIDVNHVNDVNGGSMTFFVYANCNDFDTLCLRTKKQQHSNFVFKVKCVLARKQRDAWATNIFFLQSKSASWKMSTFSRRSGSAGYDLVMMMMMMLKKVIYQICHSCVCSLLHLATFILYESPILGILYDINPIWMSIGHTGWKWSTINPVMYSNFP